MSGARKRRMDSEQGEFTTGEQEGLGTPTSKNTVSSEESESRDTHAAPQGNDEKERRNKKYRPKGYRPPGRVRAPGEPVEFKVSHKIIYDEYPHHYDQLVLRQDVDGNIEKSLLKIGIFDKDSKVLELGAGTGKLSKILLPLVAEVVVTDASEVMLKVARNKLENEGISDGVRFEVLDVREALGERFGEGVFDAVVAGWCISYIKSEMWSSPDWKKEMDMVFAQIDRVLKPGGSIVLLETLGTGTAEPNRLGGWYHDYLRENWFRMEWFRTDYLFESVDEAFMLARFFWGKGVAEGIRKKGELRLQECTALWQRKKEL